jgi:hypothetical protein
MEACSMSPPRPLLWSGLALLALAAGSLAVLALRGDPAPAYLIPAALLLGALAQALLARRGGGRRVEALRLDLDRLRPGRLRDACLRAHGYYRQLEALAETLPRPELRAALARDLPAAEAALRAIYDLCLRLQAYELGESQPPALRQAAPPEVAAVTAEAEAAVRAALDALSERYGTLRRAWSSPTVEAASLADLAPLTARLRDLAALFAPAAPVARSEPS